MPGIRLDQWEAGEGTPTQEPVAPKLQFGEALVESGKRAVGRLFRERETQRGLTQSYQAKTAQAARSFGDTANIAVQERKFMQDSFPQDGDTYESRLVKQHSIDDYLARKEQELSRLATQEVPMVLKGYSKSGPRFEQDTSLVSSKKQAQEALVKLREAKVLYEQMYDEANKLMPAIGAPQSVGTTPSGLKYTIED